MECPIRRTSAGTHAGDPAVQSRRDIDLGQLDFPTRPTDDAKTIEKDDRGMISETSSFSAPTARHRPSVLFLDAAKTNRRTLSSRRERGQYAARPTTK